MPPRRSSDLLVRDGATPLWEVEDVFEGLGLPVPEQNPETRLADDPDPIARLGQTILDALAQRALSRDELGRRIERDPRQLDLALVDLELRGLVRRDRDGRMVKARARPIGPRRPVK